MTDTTILDGGMGQELVARSKKELTPLWATQILLQEPELVEQVHADYFAAGADIATTNTYASQRSRMRLIDVEDQFEAVLISAGETAIRARDKHGSGVIAGSLGPSTKSYRPDLVLSIDEGAEMFREIAMLLNPFVEFFLLETMVSLQQIEGTFLGAQSVGKPVWVSMTVKDDDGTALRSGEPVAEAGELAKKLGAEAVLVNCSRPEAVSEAITLLTPTGLKTGAYANGFTHINEAFKDVNAVVTQLETRKDLDPEAYLEFAKTWHTSGAHIIGGCCEVGPAHIERIAEYFK